MLQYREGERVQQRTGGDVADLIDEQTMVYDHKTEFEQLS